MSNQIDFEKEIPGSYIFNGRASSKGYRINKFAMSLASSKNREAFKADKNAYLQKSGLNKKEKELVKKLTYIK